VIDTLLVNIISEIMEKKEISEIMEKKEINEIMDKKVMGDDVFWALRGNGDSRKTSCVDETLECTGDEGDLPLKGYYNPPKDPRDCIFDGGNEWYENT
jgi:hypothetical protein